MGFFIIQHIKIHDKEEEMKLGVAEKPSQEKGLADVLGAMQRNKN